LIYFGRKNVVQTVTQSGGIVTSGIDDGTNNLFYFVFFCFPPYKLKFVGNGPTHNPIEGQQNGVQKLPTQQKGSNIQRNTKAQL
jgi:hypothetical protein